jgi:uncharacterized protein involved in type VI secretion and phage assembly
MNLSETLAHGYELDSTSGRIYGVVVGIVTSLDDPDHLGRVKVKYPWLGDDSESEWARVMSFMAGGSRGAVFRPEEKDEVLVLHEHGDPRFPYVIGAVWNGSDAMPSERGTDVDNNVRIIKSRSGHKVVLDDTSGSEKVIVEDKKGNSVTLSSSGIVIKSSAIKAGSDNASEGLVLGDAFLQLFNSHTHPTGVGPSGPPVTPMVKGSHVSSKHTTE